MLGERILVNLSDHQLTNTQIEALSAGLGFVPTLPLDPEEETVLHTGATDRLIRSTNIAIHFNGGMNSSQSAKPTVTRRGHLRRWMESRWQPDRQRWQHDPQTDQVLYRLRNPCVVPFQRKQDNRHRQEKRNRRPKNWKWGSNCRTEPGVTHPKIINSLSQLIKKKEIHVMKADKGGAIVIQNTADYDREAMRQLSDTETYQSLTFDQYQTQLKEAHTQILDAAIVLQRYGHITKSELEAIRTAPLNGSTAYFLPKIHKPWNVVSRSCSGRPIMATHSCVMRLADKLLTEWTGPLLKLIHGSLIDTTDLLNKLSKEKFPATATVTTADVDSLYPCIPHERGIRASVRFYREHLSELQKHCEENGLLPPPSPALFGRLLEAVLGNSLIHFKNRYWVRQIKGTAMGMCISVYFANCYMWDVTRAIRENPPPGTVTFLRFIDDILVIQADGNRATVEEIFKSISDEHTKYTIDPPSREANFLDVTIYFGPEGRLETKPFAKPTSTVTFLHYGSNHPLHCRNSIPYSQLIRLRRITTRTENFERAAEKLITAFLNRGYPRGLLRKYRNQVLEMTQEELLGPPTLRKLTQRSRELQKHEERQRVAKQRNQVWGVPKRVRQLLEEIEAETAGDTTTDPVEPASAPPVFRFIAPYSAAIDARDLADGLRIFDATVRLNYPEGSPHHELTSKSRSTVVHKRRQPTELLFTGNIKNPKVMEPAGERDGNQE